MNAPPHLVKACLTPRLSNSIPLPPSLAREGGAEGGVLRRWPTTRDAEGQRRGCFKGLSLQDSCTCTHLDVVGFGHLVQQLKRFELERVVGVLGRAGAGAEGGEGLRW